MDSNIKLVPVSELFFDHKNPRLAEYNITEKMKESEVLSILWEAMDVCELVQSIAASGYFPHEPVIATIEGKKNIVIEGNRRLAAVKVLVDPTIAKINGWTIPKIEEAARKRLTSIPVIFANREESWRYLGFKHVNGPAKWSSYAKAKYIAEVHRTYKISLSEIAEQIGDRHRTVQKLFQGLMVLEQAGKSKVYDVDDKFSQKLAFSHLYTGLQYEGISSFVGLKPESDESTSPVPMSKLKELGELLVWLYGSKTEKKPAVIQSQNPDLRQLDAVLKKRESVSALRAGADLTKAFEISKSPLLVFEDALLAAKRELTTVRAYLTSGYDKTEVLLRLAGTVAEMAEDIYREMERKHNPEMKKRLTEE
jgi:hypothetical protein